MNVLIGSALIFGMVGTATAAVNCNTFPNSTISGSVNDDVVAVGYTCTIASTGSVNGSLLQTGDNSLVIRGVVNGEVSESGNGNITIVNGTVGGSVSEADGGNITVRGASTVNGGLEEAGAGNVTVTVDVPGVVNADIFESGGGSVFVTASSGSYEGSIIENDAGNVNVTVGLGVSFKGGVEEFGPGGVTANVAGLFEGNPVSVS